ncbi:hypothetical protein BDQ12DRAFT_674326 [Crucibulum laeve]|uniref:Uncharacterized protein n=1 Tax=Crucibulum laeve TaxID=68775 RepID=A0A5C3MEG5_9AGAR|nr:hypothetical protein BDQ12DRAFT_674326 [Crucibulum laeve]
MNNVVDNECGRFSHQSRRESDLNKSDVLPHHPQLFSRIRNLNSLAMSSIGSLFSAASEALQDDVDGDTESDGFELWDYLDNDRTPSAAARVETRGYYDTGQRGGQFDAASTPTPTRSTTPHPSSTRFPEVKRILNSFTRAQNLHLNVDRTNPLPPKSNAYNYAMRASSRDYNHQPYYPTLLDSSPHMIYDSNWSRSPSNSETPPLTPDTLDQHALPSPTSSNGYDPSLCGTDPFHFVQEEEDDEHYIRRHSREIKEGKKPEQSIYYAFNDVTELQITPEVQVATSFSALDDRDEWHGLEYTLEISSREHRLSDTQDESESAGEHSKSHASWALIHQNNTHPFLADEDYYQWQNWHRYLDKEDERRRHRKGYAFKAHAKRQAYWYAEEMLTRDYGRWQMEKYGKIRQEVKDHLVYIAQRRSDPYHPPKKHTLAWHLKRSRSVSCLRELCPLPALEAALHPAPEGQEKFPLKMQYTVNHRRNHKGKGQLEVEVEDEHVDDSSIDLDVYFDAEDSWM